METDKLEELVKELFTYFGRTYFHSEVLHKGLCHAYIFSGFQNSKDFTTPRIEEKQARAESLTLGQLIKELEFTLEADIYRRLTEALEKRNYLAHYFWYKNNHLMFSEQGIQSLIEELNDIELLFILLDGEIHEVVESQLTALGINMELLENNITMFKADEPNKPLLSRRNIKKQERIVRAWEAIIDGKIATQIFEAEDGMLLQFCDVGMGWSVFETPEINWRVDERIQKYLPANINPRPAILSPWNYEFLLTKGAVLWVKRNSQEKIYRWGIRERQ